MGIASVDSANPALSSDRDRRADATANPDTSIARIERAVRR